ncbi:MAG TPA: hypothetical protein VHA73_16255 [Acidimicrobiales bacterium]|jgi:hypothetical protein|nr:hypothetical protein [Acidimicrobiales bacterium]
MFDFTRFARGVALALPAYMLAWPVWATVAGLAGIPFHTHAWVRTARWLTWPVPCVFAVLAVGLLVDGWQRLRAHRLTTTELTAQRVAAMLMAGGSAFCVGVTPIPFAVSAAAVVANRPG